MAWVVGDVEAEEFFVLLGLFVVEEGEDEAVVLLAVVGFPVFFASEDEGLSLHFLTCRHGEKDPLSNLSL